MIVFHVLTALRSGILGLKCFATCVHAQDIRQKTPDSISMVGVCDEPPL